MILFQNAKNPLQIAADDISWNCSFYYNSTQTVLGQTSH